MLKTGNSLHELQLHMRREGRAHALYIHFISATTFRLNKKLMAVLIGEAHDFGINGRAVTRAYTLDHTIEHARKMQILTNYLMGSLVSISQIAGHLLPGLDITHKGKIAYLAITILGLHFAVVQAAGINTRRRTGLKTH